MSPAITRRQFVALVSTATALSARQGSSVDRRALVTRHNPVLTGFNPRVPLSVGNGEFAFTADITGLQSFPAFYESCVPLCTQSQWGWHSFPLPDHLDPAGFQLENYDTYGREVGYATRKEGQEQLYDWLRENPHRLNLARIGLLLDGRPLDGAMIANPRQQLDLWTGILSSRFELAGVPVTVITCCHPELDAVAISIESQLTEARRLSIAFDFPYGSTGMNASDWNSPERHTTRPTDSAANYVELARQLDAEEYFVRLAWVGDAHAALRVHRLLLSGARLDFACQFARQRIRGSLEPGGPAQLASARHWNRFWQTGGAIDLSASTDPRAAELERRIVLSQYLTAIQSCGSTPPQETGLTCNSWYGKFHLEMHWWHCAHFALWGRSSLLKRSLDWYSTILGPAREKARQQDYRGARWPKMTDPSGRSSPSPVGELLIWQQPHPIALAELCYRAEPTRETLDTYRAIVFESARFMATFAVNAGGRYVLGPPIIPAQENHPARTTKNPTFELSYWHQELAIAQNWCERLGLPREPLWDEVGAKLSKLPLLDGVYLAAETCPETFTEKNRDHPSMLCACGLLKGVGVDPGAMRRTLSKVLEVWDWPSTWGWDYPMMAMTAARLGEPEIAINALFMNSPKNEWLPNGHVYQRPNLPVYLPANGALLSAVALMASLPNGFPRRNWQVHAEALQPFI